MGGGQLWGDLEDRALRWAATEHDRQYRKGARGTLPYVQHVVGVAWILERSGFGPEVVAAGLLHDVVEDTSTTIEEIREVFGSVVADLVEACSEKKTDEAGRERPWAVRKREKLEGLAGASVEARGVGLADKLHNLRSIEADLAEGQGLWGKFKATPTEVLARYGEAVETWGHGDARLERLATECRETLRRIESKMVATPGPHVGVDLGDVR